MSRGVVAAILGLALTLTACSAGGGAAGPFSDAPACLILAQLAEVGENVQRIEVGDPEVFEAEFAAAVASYVRAARRLHAAVPARLQDDVDRMIAAAQQHRFTNAKKARADLDDYARSECKTSP